MSRYLVKQWYSSHVGTFQPNTAIEIDDELAAWMNRDSKGVLEKIVDKPPDPPPAHEPERAIEQPPKDRMVRKTKTRRK
jgi:hypothetical protein